MTIRKIIYLPDARLRRVSTPVQTFDATLHQLIDDMFDTMYDAKGVGLAAPQIGINIRLSVVDVTGDKSQQLVLVNPEIISSEGTMSYQEGCLSIPSVYNTVIRAEKVVMRAQDRFGEFYEMTADGLLGECFQHEIDHLNGTLFIDLLSSLKQSMAQKKLEKFKRHQAQKS
jgi:peptide deformylase